jgi:hypothetical protein
MTVSNREQEQPLPLYGLAGSFVGERWMEDESWGTSTGQPKRKLMCEIGHRPAGSEEKLSVTVIRRTTGRPVPGGPWVAIPPDLARESVTSALVVPTWRTGDEDIFSIRKRVANDEHAWKAREIGLDGQVVTGYEREYKGRWVVYHLTPTLIVLVAAPVALRPDVVELRRLECSEFKPLELESYSSSDDPAADE